MGEEMIGQCNAVDEIKFDFTNAMQTMGNSSRSVASRVAKLSSKCTPSITVNKVPNEDGTIGICIRSDTGSIVYVDLAREQIVDMVQDGSVAAARQTLVDG